MKRRSFQEDERDCSGLRQDEIEGASPDTAKLQNSRHSAAQKPTTRPRQLKAAKAPRAQPLPTLTKNENTQTG